MDDSLHWDGADPARPFHRPLHHIRPSEEYGTFVADGHSYVFTVQGTRVTFFRRDRRGHTRSLGYLAGLTAHPRWTTTPPLDRLLAAARTVHGTCGCLPSPEALAGAPAPEPRPEVPAPVPAPVASIRPGASVQGATELRAMARDLRRCTKHATAHAAAASLEALAAGDVPRARDALASVARPIPVPVALLFQSVALQEGDPRAAGPRVAQELLRALALGRLDAATATLAGCRVEDLGVA